MFSLACCIWVYKVCIRGSVHRVHTHFSGSSIARPAVQCCVCTSVGVMLQRGGSSACAHQICDICTDGSPLCMIKLNQGYQGSTNQVDPSDLSHQPLNPWGKAKSCDLQGHEHPAEHCGAEGPCRPRQHGGLAPRGHVLCHRGG